tara:strand:+ start:1258 stop:2418 length:1161 start_codon:yes stop_codon:yes gene_type:complete
MNIAIISYIYPKKINHSQGVFIHQQARCIAKEGHTVHVITTRSHGDKKFETWDNVNIHRVASIDYLKPIAGLLFLINTLTKIFELHKKKKVDVVIGGFMGITTIATGLFLKLINKRFFAISYGTKWELPKKNWISNLIIRSALYFPEKIICVSRKTKELVGRNTDLKKLYVVNNGADSEYLVPSKSKSEFRKQLGVRGKLVILTVSNLVNKKGIDIIIKSISKVSKEYQNFIYLIVGKGYHEDKFKNLVKKLKLEKYIRFEGNLENFGFRERCKELANYYNICDIFTLMSHDAGGEIESLGLVYIEASYFGIPVVGGISGGTRDSIIGGETGYLIDSKDQVKLENTLLSLLKNKKLREKLGNAGRKRILREKLAVHNAKEILEIIK